MPEIATGRGSRSCLPISPKRAYQKSAGVGTGVIGTRVWTAYEGS